MSRPCQNRSLRLATTTLAAACALVAGSCAVAADARGEVTATGSFTLDFPIDVPYHRGLEPRLHLSYDSRSGDGPLGVGWKLAGLSTIERTSPGGGAPRFDGADVFVLDGVELKPCRPDTTSPSCKYPPPQHRTQFALFAPRTETYQRIAWAARSGGGSWYVWERDGTRLVYTADDATSERPTRWTLSRVEDTIGNRVRYHYMEAAGNSVFGGERYLDSITYNKAKIKLHYEQRPDVFSYAVGSGLVAQDRRLKTIDITVDGKRARAYALRYTTTGLAPVRSALRKIQRYGTDATVARTGAVRGPRHVRPVRLDYPDVPTGAAWAGEAAAPTGQEPGTGPATDGIYRDREVAGVGVGAKYGPVTTGDVDGDGRTDWVSAGFPGGQSGIVVTTALAGATTTISDSLPFEPDPQLEGPGLIPHTVYSSTMDLNGDGRSDLLLAVGYPYVLGEVRGQQVVYERIGLTPALSLGDGTYDMRPSLRTPIDQLSSAWMNG
jgi:Salmonella virulence plasmid 65kDa B protein